MSNQKLPKQSQEITSPKLCVVCHSTLENSSHYTYIPTSVNALTEFTTSSINRCNKCGFGGIDNAIPDHRLNLYYSKHYGGKSRKEELINRPFQFRSKTHILNSRYGAQLELIKQFKFLDDKTRWLEIGAGKGDMFNMLKFSELGGVFFVIEPDTSALKMLQHYGVKLISGDIRDISTIPSETFDVIVMSHVLEHFNPKDIRIVLENIKKLLGKDGVFLCEVPNADLEKYPNACENLVPHLSFFTKNSIRLLINDLNLKILYANAVGHSQCLKNHQLAIEQRLSDGRMDTVLLEDDGIILNTYTHPRKLTHTLKDIAIRGGIKIFGTSFTAKIFNIVKAFRNHHPTKYLNDATNEFCEDGENLRVLIQK